MKKVIFGCALMISGIIGSSAWLIANALLHEPGGAWDKVTDIFGSTDGIVVILFFGMAVLGTVIAVQALGKDND